MSNTSSPGDALSEDIRAALDRIAADALKLREDLVRPYATLSEDELLGEPKPFDFQSRPDGLDRLVDRTVVAGGSTRHLDEIGHSVSLFDHLVHSYSKRLLVMNTVGDWRDDVERMYSNLFRAIATSRKWLDGWRRGPKRSKRPAKRPNLALLDELDLLSTEDLADVLGVGKEAASRRRRKHEFGSVTTGRGRRKFVQSSEVRRALQLPPPSKNGD